MFSSLIKMISFRNKDPRGYKGKGIEECVKWVHTDEYIDSHMGLISQTVPTNPFVTSYDIRNS